MTVYVDNMNRRARVGRLSAVWCHLMADTHEELVEFAVSIGLRPEWIQNEGKRTEHFDVTAPKRQAAVEAGAVEIQYGREGAILTFSKAYGVPFDLAAVRDGSMTLASLRAASA